MIRKFAWTLALTVGFGVLSAGLGEAQAAKKRYSIDTVQTALRFVDQLETNAQRMTAEALQLALNIEPEHSYANFKRSRDNFETVLSTLQRGDDALALPAPTDPRLLEPLQKLQGVWDQIDDPIQRVLKSGKVSRHDLEELTELDNVLIEASRETEQAYQDVLQAQVPFSMALNNIVKAEHLSFLVEQIKTEFLLIAYGHEAKRQRQNLGRSTAEFELILNGLIHGDPDLHLVRAPDAKIAAQLRKVELIWLEVAQTFKQAAATDVSTNPDTLRHVTEHMEPLFAEMEKSVDLLEQL